MQFVISSFALCYQAFGKPARKIHLYICTHARTIHSALDFIKFWVPFFAFGAFAGWFKSARRPYSVRGPEVSHLCFIEYVFFSENVKRLKKHWFIYGGNVPLRWNENWDTWRCMLSNNETTLVNLVTRLLLRDYVRNRKKPIKNIFWAFF